MTVLVVGATGATGQRLVENLLDRGLSVKVIVRSASKLPGASRQHAQCTVISASILDLSDAQLAQHSRGCGAVVSCLGHTLSFRGVYGQPRRLVTEATRRLCRAIKANTPARPVKFILMNSSGCSNRDIPEQVAFGQRCVIAVLRVLVPPHLDNERAADYLRVQIGQYDNAIEWVAIRPDSLIDAEQVSAYEVYESPIRSAIFDPGATSRINVGDFMANLITSAETWNTWKGKMPVIYNRTSG